MAKTTITLTVTDGGASPGWRRVDWADASEDAVYVSEIAEGLIAVAVDEDDEECDPDYAVRDVGADYAEHIVCMRGPHKKTPPHSDPIAAIRDAVARRRYKIDPTAAYILDGVDITEKIS